MGAASVRRPCFRGKEAADLQTIKLAVCDMDGTLLTSRKEFSPRTVEVMARAARQGLFVTICSGRVYPMLEYYWRAAGISGPIIASNGAHIVDTATGNTLWEAVIDPAQALGLMDFCRDRGLDYSALCGDGCYFSPVSIRRGRFVQYNAIAAQTGCAPIPLYTLAGPDPNRVILSKKIHKLLVYDLAAGDTHKARGYIAAHTTLDCTSSEPGLLDISAAGVSKGTGLVRLAELLGLPLSQTCAFGDFENDIPMFRVAGLSVAMGNGSPAAKAAAHRVTRTNDQDGVAAVLEELLG